MKKAVFEVNYKMFFAKICDEFIKFVERNKIVEI